MLRAARELLAVRSPLDAELMVSELLGTWWGQHGGGRRAATVEQLVGEGLVDYAGEQRSPAALALLSGIACLGTSRQAAKAERAALELIEAGVPCPGWAQHLGAVRGGGGEQGVGGGGGGADGEGGGGAAGGAAGVRRLHGFFGYRRQREV